MVFQKGYTFCLASYIPQLVVELKFRMKEKLTIGCKKYPGLFRITQYNIVMKVINIFEGLDET